MLGRSDQHHEALLAVSCRSTAALTRLLNRKVNNSFGHKKKKKGEISFVNVTKLYIAVFPINKASNILKKYIYIFFFLLLAKPKTGVMC